MKPRVFWSWWVRPYQYIWIHLTCYTLSLSYAKKNGAYCVLYTDKKGAELVKGLPFDEVHIIYDTEIPEKHNQNLFAISKILAYQHEPLGSIHIDGDVFLMRKSLIDSIANGDFDVMTQHNESYDNVCLIDNYNTAKKLGYGLLDEYLTYFCGGWNCGLVCFKNQELKDKYINEYLRLAKKYSDMYNNEWSDVKVPDLIIEQCMLKQISKGYKADFVIPENSFADDSVAKSKGYCHYLSCSKIQYNYQIVDKLKERNEDYLEIIKENYNNYEKNSK